MPTRPKVPCAHPLCPELVKSSERFCEKHKALHPETRRSASERGYNRAWQKEREAFLEEHPFCVQCWKEGKRVLATDVDHIIPHRGDKSLFWDRSNWQPLCHRHHSIKTMKEDRFPVYTY